MKWVASTPVVIFGTSYGAGQSVDTETWTNEQIHQQVYLGHIVPDTRIGTALYFEGEGSSWNLAQTDLRSTRAAAGAFTAPESGKVLVVSSLLGRARVTDGTLLVHVRIGLRARLRTGPLVAATPQLTFRGTHRYLQVASHLVSDLTAGERYNACQVMENGPGGAAIQEPVIQIIPVST